MTIAIAMVEESTIPMTISIAIFFLSQYQWQYQ